jgi:hypothetical protein
LWVIQASKANIMDTPESALQVVARDPIIWRDQLQSVLGVSGNTVRRWLIANKLPKPDIYPTRLTMGWHLATLKAAGFDLARQSKARP